MKSLLEQKKSLSSITSEKKNKLQVKENNHLFNHISKLALEHDVTFSNTMIKITYKKALKDQNAVNPSVNCNVDSGFDYEKKKQMEATDLCRSDISFIVKSPNVQVERSRGLLFHSTPKQQTNSKEKKKKYVNGVNLSIKTNNSEIKSSVGKVQKPFLSLEESLANSKKSNKQTTKIESKKKFLKGNSVVKPKASIIQRGGIVAKKKILAKGSEGKVKKIETGVNKKGGAEKGGKKVGGALKRKGSRTEINDLEKCKKIKISESKVKEVEVGGRVEEVHKSGGKKEIMLVDPDLPTGWTRFIRTKNKGSANEQYVVYVVNPQGKKFRFKWKLRKYLQRTNSPLDPNQFFFGLYQRPKTSSGTEGDGGKPKRRGPASEEAPNGIQSEPVNGGTKADNPREASRSSEGKEILFYDPDLPFGWKRIIHSNTASGRKQVHIISPDGKIFRRRYRLNEYLTKHQFTHNLDRFYFGLYPKREGTGLEAEEKPSTVVQMYQPRDNTKGERSRGNQNKSGTTVVRPGVEYGDDVNDDRENSGEFKMEVSNPPMYDDPNLPEGWKRFIKIRSCGESAGRMEVVIVSPDGRRHRSKKHLEHYLMQTRSNLKAGDFDFTVFGRSNLKGPSTSAPEGDTESEPESASNDLAFSSTKKKFTDKPVPELDINSLKETVLTPEGRLINTVNGLMMCCGLSTARSERRQKLPRGEHEKQVKSFLSSEKETSWEGCRIPTRWIQKLVKCRSDFRRLEEDAASSVAEATAEFIKKVSAQALANSDHQERGLRYEDLAELVDRTEGLSFLKALVPKKITFREYVRLNRPKQFLSFT